MNKKKLMRIVETFIEKEMGYTEKGNDEVKCVIKEVNNNKGHMGKGYLEYDVVYKLKYKTKEGVNLFQEEVKVPLIALTSDTKKKVISDFISKMNAICEIQLYSNRNKIKEMVEIEETVGK